LRLEFQIGKDRPSNSPIIDKYPLGDRVQSGNERLFIKWSQKANEEGICLQIMKNIEKVK